MISFGFGLGGFRGRNYASGVEINSELVKLTVNLEGARARARENGGQRGQKSRFWTYRALQWSDDVHTRSTLEV